MKEAMAVALKSLADRSGAVVSPGIETEEELALLRSLSVGQARDTWSDIPSRCPNRLGASPIESPGFFTGPFGNRILDWHHPDVA